jgi:ABC-type transporter Mla subunit MlaD
MQDLTPQLRTRLSRTERLVGWFVFLATALLLFGFGYYLYRTAETRGWFVIKAKFHTFVQSSVGLNVGDPIVMMGFPVGNITLVHAMPPDDAHNVRLEFEVREPYFRYLTRQGSRVIVNSSGFLSQRQLEITRGTNHSYALCVTQPVFDKTIAETAKLIAAEPTHWQLAQDVFDADSNVVYHAYTLLDTTNLSRIAGLYTIVDAINLAPIAALPPPSNTICVYNNTINRKEIVGSWHERRHRYVNFTPDKDSAWLVPDEPVGVGEQLAQVVAQVQAALPNFFALTNQLNRILNNTANLTSNLDATVVDVRPAMTNVVNLTALLREPGGMGLWALGTNGTVQLTGVLTNVNTMLAITDTNLNRLLLDSDTNLNTLVLSIGETLDHVADITSNLNAQVKATPNMLPGISKTIGDTDDFIQGLKRHWLLRSAFKKKPAGTNSVTK